MAFQCSKVLEEVEVNGHHNDLFKDEIPKDLAKTIVNIVEFRRKYLEERMI